MIQQETELEVADNTGAKKVKCIKVLGGTRKRYARAGDKIICSVREAEATGVVKKKEIVTVVIVGTKDYTKRKDGSKLRFSSNRGVILDDKEGPRGTRIFGPVMQEVKQRGFIKICSLAEEVI